MKNAKESRKLSTGILLKNEEVTYKLNVWVDNDSTTEQSSDKNWIGKVVVISTLNKNPYRTLSLNPTGGTQVTNSTQWTSSQTIYAHWTSTTRTYTITVRNGTGSETYAYGPTLTIKANVPRTSFYYNGTCSGGGLG